MVGCPAIKVQGGALLILLHDYFTLRTPAVLAEVGLGKFRLYNVVVTSSHSEEAPVECYFGWQALTNAASYWTDHRELLPDADILLQ